MSDTISPLPSSFLSFPMDVEEDVAVCANKWHIAKDRFGDSMMALCGLLAQCLNKSIEHTCPENLSVDGIGICRNRSDVLVLNVAKVSRHTGNPAAGDDFDATACHMLRYSLRRNGDRLVIRPLRHSERHGEGGTGAIGWHLPNQGELVVRTWEDLLAGASPS